MRITEEDVAREQRTEVESPPSNTAAAGLDVIDPRERIMARLRFLWDHRRLLLRGTARGLVIFILIALLIPARYDSTTRLMPPDPQGSSSMTIMAALAARTGDGFAGYAGDLFGVKSSGALFVGVLRSRSVEDQLIRRFDLRKVYWVIDWESARRELEANTVISEDRRSGIIEIRVRDKSPRRAQALAQAYVEELDRVVAKLASSSARREREFLEERMKTVKRELDQAATDFSQFASKNSAINVPEQGRAMVEAAARLQGELIAAESERKGLEQIYTPNNVRVRSAQARTSELRKQLEKLGGADTETGGGSSTTDESMYPSIRKLPLLGVTYADLYRRTKIQEVVYEALTKQYELAKVQEAKEIPSVKVLDPANVPERHSFPPRTLIVCLGLLISLGVTIAYVVGSAAWERIGPQDPRKEFVLEVTRAVRATEPWRRAAALYDSIADSRFWARQRRRAAPSPGDPLGNSSPPLGRDD